jgi:hypothetical protein
VWLASVAVSSAQSSPGTQFDFGGYVQLQYDRVDVGSVSRDRVLFRRLIAGVEMTLNEKWAGEIQVDVGPIAIGGRLLIRDAYLQYRGFQDRGHHAHAR